MSSSMWCVECVFVERERERERGGAGGENNAASCVFLLAVWSRRKL